MGFECAYPEHFPSGLVRGGSPCALTETSRAVGWAWLALVPALLVSFAAGVLMGLLIAWSTNDPRALFSVAQFFTFSLGLFAPVFYPLSVLQLPARVVAMGLPTTYSAELVHDSITGNMGAFLNDLWPLVVIVAILAVLVRWRTKWRHEQ